MNTEDRARLRNSIALHEGLRLQPYLDTVNKLTIGVGRNVEDNPLTGAEWRSLFDSGGVKVSLTSQGAMTVLDNDIAAAEKIASRLPVGWDTLDGVRQGVLVEMTFQMGYARMTAFVHTLESVRLRDFIAAATGMRNSLWFKQVPTRANTLAKRMEFGIWTQ